MIKATIQRTPYATEMSFPCTEAQLSTWLDELRMNPEHLCPATTITQIEPSELSVLEDCEVSLDALNYLAKRMDGMDAKEQNQFFAVLTCEELNMVWGLKNIINLTFNLDRFTLIEDTSDLEKVGRTHMLNIRGGIACSELENKEWLIEEGQKLLNSGKGIQTEYGLLFVNDGIEFAEIFNGTTFPQYYCDPDAVVSVEIFYCGLTELVELPCEDLTIKKALCRLGADSIKECKLDVDSAKNISDEWWEKINAVKHTKDIFGLNKMLKTEDICLKQEQPTSVFITEVERKLRSEGYDVTQDGDFLAQSRKRVYIVGHRRPERAGKIFPVECGDCKSPVEVIGGPQGSRVYSAEGTAITLCAGGSGGGNKTGIYFFDMNSNFDFTENARCLLARYDSGVSNHKGVNSGVFIEMDAASAETLPGFVRFVDKNGVLRVGIMRKLLPLEAWRLQGFSDEQFNKAAALGLSDSHLYRFAGNAVSVPVIKAIGEKIRNVIFDERSEIIAESHNEPPALIGESGTDQ